MLKKINYKLVAYSALIVVLFLTASAFKFNQSIDNQNSSSSGMPGIQTPITGDVGQLRYFFNALKEARSKKMRIAHFGDSIIEGDLISSDLREYLQQKFGGNGAGFLSMNSFDVQFRKSTRQSFSSDWKASSIFTRNPDKLPVGLNGSAYCAVENSWVKFEVSNYSKWLKSFKAAKIYYTNASNNATLKYSFNNGSVQYVKLQPGNTVKEITLSSSSDAHSVQVNFSSCGNTVFYGVSLENGNGVYVDNFPLRGNSGVSITDIPTHIMKDFNNILNYKLIILQFGLNVLTAQQNDYAWYVNKMDNVINNLKQAFPNASFLLISVGDKSEKQGSRFVTHAGVMQLIKAQKTIADKNRIAFWNMYEAMGGKNSMEQWVSANPPLAFKDYSHLTYEGATRVGQLLFQALMNEYNKVK